MIAGGACGAFWPPLLEVFSGHASGIQREVYGETADPLER